MKKAFCVILIVLSCLSGNLYGQYKNEISIGIESKSFFFQSYNKHDWHDKPFLLIDNPRSPNGYSVGITFEYNLEDAWGINSDITYSKQYQKYLWSTAGIGNRFIYNVDIKRDLDYINIPIQLYYHTEIGYHSNYYIKLSLGLNISYLSQYILAAKKYYVSHGKIYKDSLINYIKIENNNYHRETHEEDGSFTIYNGEISNPFHKFIFGVIGSVSIERYYLNIVKFGLGLDFYHAFTNIDNAKKGEFWYGFTGYGHTAGSMGTTLNRYMGLSFSVKYIINPQSYYK